MEPVFPKGVFFGVTVTRALGFKLLFLLSLGTFTQSSSMFVVLIWESSMSVNAVVCLD